MLDSSGRTTVDLDHEFPVRGACGGEALALFDEFSAEIEDLLFQLGGAACEGLDVGRGAEAGGIPSCLSQGLGQAPFEPGDVRGQRPLRAVRFATSVSSDLRLTCVPAVVLPGGG
ncbi:hypothetical protein MHW47_02340 [Streptomyces sp. OfavH-34-F]|uniref:hypothetical protein n=1 Tax=Streptomyces sp. OfavH-34-F TaxID=2917760 RepID=UPI001EF210DF|nr:hypothetical protein [Streptomyces sp. OfavH-34-F]MCG7523292.1 hypothetical protein [Streptomyces sp. OfavH-34-F]